MFLRKWWKRAQRNEERKPHMQIICLPISQHNPFEYKTDKLLEGNRQTKKSKSTLLNPQILSSNGRCSFYSYFFSSFLWSRKSLINHSVKEGKSTSSHTSRKPFYLLFTCQPECLSIPAYSVGQISEFFFCNLHCNLYLKFKSKDSVFEEKRSLHWLIIALNIDSETIS